MKQPKTIPAPSQPIFHSIFYLLTPLMLAGSRKLTSLILTHLIVH